MNMSFVAIVKLLQNPFVRALLVALAVCLSAGGLLARGFYKGWEARKSYEQHERTNAIKKGTAARNRALKRFDAGRLRDDGFARD